MTTGATRCRPSQDSARRAPNQGVVIREQPRWIFRPDPHVEIPVLVVVLALERLPDQRGRYGVPRPEAVRHEVLDAVQAILSVRQSLVQQELRPLHVRLRVDVSAIEMV